MNKPLLPTPPMLRITRKCARTNFICDFQKKYNVQAPVRDMVKHFKKAWSMKKECSSYLHQIFPNGGPQKQGNRLAGVRKPKGEH